MLSGVKVGWPTDLGWQEGWSGTTLVQTQPTWDPRDSLPQGGLEWPPHKHTSHFNALSSNSSIPTVSLRQPGAGGVAIMPMLQMRKLRAGEEKEVAEPMEDLRALAPYLELSPPQPGKAPS